MDLDLGVLDLLRIIDIALFGFTMGTAIFINKTAWCLRGRIAGNPGLVPWHITAVTIAMLLSYGWNAHEVLIRVGDPFTWRVPLLLVIGVLYATAMRIIYVVQTRRIRLGKAIESITSPDPAPVIKGP